MNTAHSYRHVRFAAAVAAMLLLDYPLGATVVPRLHLEDLAGEAEIVVQGRVLRHYSAWDAAGKFIWTHYEIEVSDAIKGSHPRVVTVSEPGGVVGAIGMQVAGVTRYADKEEVIVFLHRTPFGRWRTYGYGQGKFSVTPLARGGKAVRTNTAGVLLVDRSASRGPRRMTSESLLQRLDGMELEEFKTRVRRAVTLGAR
jgi:hypothetical protein